MMFMDQCNVSICKFLCSNNEDRNILWLMKAPADSVIAVQILTLTQGRVGQRNWIVLVVFRGHTLSVNGEHNASRAGCGAKLTNKNSRGLFDPAPDHFS